MMRGRIAAAVALGAIGARGIACSDSYGESAQTSPADASVDTVADVFEADGGGADVDAAVARVLETKWARAFTGAASPGSLRKIDDVDARQGTILFAGATDMPPDFGGGIA